jgi:hypothetical protein
VNISIEIIPHSKQRYDTVGDWIFDANGALHIYVSEMGSEEYESMVAVHEVWEALLCKNRGISQKSVDAFDIAFEVNRIEGNTEEPGDNPNAPYHREHCSATGVERLLCSELGIPWKLYEETVERL